MSRILNSVLVGVVAFFALLAAFTFSGLSPVDGGPAPRATLSLVTAQWAGKAGSDLEVRLVVHNQGNAAEARAVEYRTVVDGRKVDEGRARLDEDLPIGHDATLRFTTSLGDRFASRWWPDYMRAAESSSISIEGEIQLREGGQDRVLPFVWNRTWEGNLADLPEALQDCPAPASPVCLDGATASWQGSGLSIALRVRNQDPRDLRVGDGEVTLSFAGDVVARGAVAGTDIPAGGSATLPITLRFDGAALDAWWPGHVGRCEASQARIHVELPVEDAQGLRAGTATWDTPPTLYTTGLACEGAA